SQLLAALRGGRAGRRGIGVQLACRGRVDRGRVRPEKAGRGLRPLPHLVPSGPGARRAGVLLRRGMGGVVGGRVCLGRDEPRPVPVWSAHSRVYGSARCGDRTAVAVIGRPTAQGRSHSRAGGNPFRKDGSPPPREGLVVPYCCSTNAASFTS